MNVARLRQDVADVQVARGLGDPDVVLRHGGERAGADEIDLEKVRIATRPSRANRVAGLEFDATRLDLRQSRVERIEDRTIGLEMHRSRLRVGAFEIQVARGVGVDVLGDVDVVQSPHGERAASEEVSQEGLGVAADSAAAGFQNEIAADDSGRSDRRAIDDIVRALDADIARRRRVARSDLEHIHRRLLALVGCGSEENVTARGHADVPRGLEVYVIALVDEQRCHRGLDAPGEGECGRRGFRYDLIARNERQHGAARDGDREVTAAVRGIARGPGDADQRTRDITIGHPVSTGARDRIAFPQSIGAKALVIESNADTRAGVLGGKDRVEHDGADGHAPTGLVHHGITTRKRDGITAEGGDRIEGEIGIRVEAGPLEVDSHTHGEASPTRRVGAPDRGRIASGSRREIHGRREVRAAEEGHVAPFRRGDGHLLVISENVRTKLNRQETGRAADIPGRIDDRHVRGDDVRLFRIGAGAGHRLQ